jgi:hypothetical protein
MIKKVSYSKLIHTFVPTVLATLSIRTASQGESFAFYNFYFKKFSLIKSLKNEF